jgi:hypothetical protein
MAGVWAKTQSAVELVHRYGPLFASRVFSLGFASQAEIRVAGGQGSNTNSLQ